MTDLPPADIVHVWLNRGRDNAEPIGSLAERLKLTRRQVEQGIQELRLRGVAVCSGPDGIWLGDVHDLEETVATLKHRIDQQRRTLQALEKSIEDHRQRIQMKLFDAA